ncbi:hypothetical protein [Polluticaenibacter yanchengensis]|uniref:Uncharacterized protein n=1 Tax=Polluticaenibacter yanchengensis TaxID=3014562 RepID=A0ABT4UEW5_9BACT|nr:hypothetical protein [Chitinophagaceae bacterium LY-5]
MQESERESRFGGIIGGLRRLIFTDEPPADNPKPAPTPAPVPKVESQPVAPVIVTPVTVDKTIDEKELVKKIYQLFESINKPGVDFFELWNAVEAMGGPTPANIQNAFTTLRVLGLTKDSLLLSGRDYIREIDEKINQDINSKQQEKNQLVQQSQHEKSSLQSKSADLEQKISLLQKELQEVKTQLAQVDSKYAQPIAVINDKINVGSSALRVVTHEINLVINTIEGTIK